MDKYRDLYNTDTRFHNYVDACVKAEGRSMEEVLSEKTIQNVGDYYKDNPQREAPTVTTTNCSCGGC